MMLLFDKRFVLGKFCEKLGSVLHHPIKNVHADRKIRPVNKRTATRSHQEEYVILLIVPAGGALYDWNARLYTGLDIAPHCARNRKIDGDVGISQLPRDLVGRRIFAPLVNDRDYLISRFFSEGFDQPSHRTVSNKSNFHKRSLNPVGLEDLGDDKSVPKNRNT